MKTYSTQRSPKKRRFRPVFRLRRRERKPFPKQVVPNFFTLMNLFAGFMAIIHVLEGELVIAAWLIVAAGAFDALDGFMARLTNTSSEFGIELDSLCDLVSFGVAPAFLMYSFVLNEFQMFGMLISAMPVLCGAVRLARFNVETKIEENSYFRGLPIPVQAIMLSAFFLTFHENLHIFDLFEYGVNSVVIPSMLLFSFLMITTVPFDKVPRFNRAHVRKHKNTIFLFLLYFILILVMQEYGLMIAFSIFILKGLVLAAVNLYRDLLDDSTSSDVDD